jgi:hypothetical protein
MHVVDGPLVDYYKSCVADLQRSGFHGLILALVRDADAPTFYDDLLRYWNSMNDLTGHHLVFAVAGGSAAERVGVGAIHGRGCYSENMALAEKNTFEIERLRLMAGPRRNVQPLLANLGDANTAQITALCEHLKVDERDLPCLHVTHLESGKCRVLPLSTAPSVTVYTACKSIVSQLQQAFRAFDQASIVSSLPERQDVQQRLSQLKEELIASQRATYAIDQRHSRPPETIERDQLAAYFQSRLNERPDFTDPRIRHLVDLCKNPDRTSGDLGPAKTILKELALIPRLDQKAHRMVNVAFSEQAIGFDVVDRQKAQDNDRRQALAQSVAETDAQLRDLRQQEYRLHAEERTTIERQQQPCRRAIFEAFLALRPSLPLALWDSRWDFFISYAAQDRRRAIQVFHQLEKLGPTFMDIFCLLPGQDWQAFLPEIQMRCQFTVPLLSVHSRAAHFQNSEIQRAINLMRQGRHHIFPIHIDDDANTPFGLEQLHAFRYVPTRNGLAPLRRSLAQLGYAGPSDRHAARD